MGFLDVPEECAFSHAKNVLKKKRDSTSYGKSLLSVLLKHRRQGLGWKYLGQWFLNPQILRITLTTPDIMSQILNLYFQRLLNELDGWGSEVGVIWCQI